MAFNFPTPQSDGEQFTVGDTTWIWNSTKGAWDLLEGIVNLEKIQLIDTPGSLYNVDIVSNQVVYVTSNATSNWTVNVRASSTGTLNAALATGTSVTVVVMAAQGATAYYNDVFQVDGVAQTVRWIDADAPVAGTPNSVDTYSYTIIKTNNSTYTVLGSLAPYLT